MGKPNLATFQKPSGKVWVVGAWGKILGSWQLSTLYPLECAVGYMGHSLPLGQVVTLKALCSSTEQVVIDGFQAGNDDDVRLSPILQCSHP